MASNLTSIHDRVKAIAAALAGVGTVSDTPEDYDTWEDQVVLTPVRVPACHVRTEASSTFATTDGDVEDTVKVEVRFLVPQKGSAKSRLNDFRDALVSAMASDATLWGYCDMVTHKGAKTDKQMEQFHRLSVEFEIKATWTP